MQECLISVFMAKRRVTAGGPPGSMGDAQQGQPRSAEAQIPEVGETHNQLSHQTAVKELAAPSSAIILNQSLMAAR